MFETLYHVGDFRGVPNERESHEATCLSVSEVPEAWRQIARLGTAPTWEFTRKGNKFLRALKLTKGQKKGIIDWGISQGLAVAARVCKSIIQDEDGRQEWYMYKSPEEGIDEHGEEDEEPGVRHELIPYALPTANLELRMMQRVSIVMLEDMLSIAYAEDVLDLDGVYWAERLNVLAYSAPRAGILRSRVRDWTYRQVPARY